MKLATSPASATSFAGTWIRPKPAHRMLTMLLMALACVLASLAVSAAIAIAAPEQAFAAAYACYCADDNGDGTADDGVLIFINASTSSAPAANKSYNFSDGTRTITAVYASGNFKDKGFSTSSNAPWYGYRSNIKKVLFQDSTNTTTSMKYWFRGCAIQELSGSWWGEQNFFSKVTDCSYMFTGCTSLTSVTLAGLEMPALTNASYMFNGCTKLANIEISGWLTDSLTDASYLCNGCTDLVLVHIASWTAPKLQNLSRAFRGCTSLRELGKSWINESTGKLEGNEVDLASWTPPDTLTNMSYLFNGCTSLGTDGTNARTVDLSGWTCSSATNISYLFYGCSGMTTANLAGVSFPKATSAINMFQNCSSLTDLDLTDSDFPSVTSMKNFLDGCSSLESVDLSTCSLGDKVTASSNASEFFKNCTSLREIKVGPSWPATAVSAAANFPQGVQDGATANYLWYCVETGDYVSHSHGTDPACNVPSPADTGRVDGEGNSTTATYRAGVVANRPIAVFCSESSTLYFYLSDATARPTVHDGHPVTAVYGGYDGFDAKSKANVWWTANGINVHTVKFECDFKPTSTAFWFCDLTQLASIEGIAHLDISAITSAQQWFYNCQSLDFTESSGGVAAYLARMSCPNLEAAQHLCFKCAALTDAALPGMLSFISGGVSPNLTDAKYAFSECTGLTSADLSGRVMPSATDLTYLFKSCTQLQRVNAHGLNLPEAVNAQFAFNLDTALSSVDLSGLSAPKLTTATSMFQGCTALPSLGVGSGYGVNVDALNTPLLATATSAFNGCTALTQVNLAGTELFPKLATATSMFQGCTSLTNASFSAAKFPAFATATSLFQGCTSLASVDLSGADLSALVTATSLFQGCTALTTFGASGCDVNTEGLSATAVATTTTLFSGCSALESVDVSHLDVSAMKTSTSMLLNCNRLDTIKVNDTFGSKNAVQAIYPPGYKDGASCGYLWYCEESMSTLSSENNTTLTTFAQSGSVYNVATYRSGAQVGALAAAYIAADNELCFYRMGADDDMTKHDGRTVTNFYNGSLENKSYSYANTPWYGIRFNVKKVVFEDTLSPESMAWWFADFEALDSFPSLNKLDLSANTSFEGTFMGCAAITKVDMTDWSCPLVTTAHAMFARCTSLEEADLTGWQAASMATLYEMFARCTSLKTLLGRGASLNGSCRTVGTRTIARNASDPYEIWSTDYSSAATKYTYTFSLFNGCSSLRYAGNSDYIEQMGEGIDLSWLANVSSWQGLLGESVTKVSGSSTTVLLDTGGLPIVGLDLSGISCPNLTTTENMLYGDDSLAYANLSGWEAPKLATATNMLDKGSPLKVMGSADFVAQDGDGSGVVVDRYRLSGHFTVFAGLTKLQSVDLSDCEMPALSSMGSMFNGCTALSRVCLEGFCPPEVTTVATMLNGCTALSHLNLSRFAPPKLTTLTNMIEKTAPLLTMGSADFVRDVGNGSGIVVDYYALAGHGNMFQALNKLQEINLENCSAPALASASAMFSGCSDLHSAKLGGWSSPALTTAFAMFGKCASLQVADLRGWYAPQCTNLVEMFANCGALTTCLSEGAVLGEVVTLYGSRSISNKDSYGIWSPGGSSSPASSSIYTFSTFSGCSSLRYAGGADFVNDMGEGVDLSAFCSATSWRMLFGRSYCTLARTYNVVDTGIIPLKSVDLSGLICPNLTTMRGMFSTQVYNSTSAAPSSISQQSSSLEYANLDMEAPGLTDTSQMFDDCLALGKVVVGESWPQLSSMYQTFPEGMQGGNPTRYLWYCDETQAYVNTLDQSSTRIPTVAEANPGGTVATYIAGVKPNTLVGVYTQEDAELSLYRTDVFPAATTDGGLAVTALYIDPEKTAYTEDAEVPWNDYRAVIATVTVQGDAAAPAGAGAEGGRSPVTYWFDNMTALTSIQGLSGIDVSGAGNLSGAFAGCSALAELNLEGWDTASVSDMSDLLKGCAALERVQVGAGFSQAGVAERKEATFPDQLETTRWYEVLNYNLIGIGFGVPIPTNDTDHSLVYVNDEPCFYAVFCAGDKSLTFVGDTVKKMPAVGTAYEPAGGALVSATYKIWAAGSLIPDAYKQWSAQRREVELVRVPYLVSAPSSATHWFEGFTELTRFEGFTNLVTADTTDFAYLFNGCTSLQSLDFTGQDTRAAEDMTAMLSGCTKLETFSMGERFAQEGIAEGREVRFPVVAGEEWVDGDGEKYDGGDVVPDGAGTYTRKLTLRTISVTAPEAGIDLGAEKDGTLTAVTGEAIRNNGPSRVSVTGWTQADVQPFEAVEAEGFPGQGDDGDEDGSGDDGSSGAEPDEIVNWYAKVRTQLAPAAYDARYISADAQGIYPGGAAGEAKDGTWTMAAAGTAGGADKLTLSVDDGKVELEPRWWIRKTGLTESYPELAGTVTWQLAASDATVTFVANGGPDVPAQEVPIGSHVDAPEYTAGGVAGTYVEGETKATIEGIERTFAGWYTDRDFSEDAKWSFDTERVTANTVLYAKWVGDPIVRFELEGGAWTDNKVGNPQAVAEGETVTRPSNPSKLGGVLDYWYAWDASGIRVWDFDTDTVTGDIVLHAHYKDHAIVTFNPNGGTLDGGTEAKSVEQTFAADALPAYTLERMEVAAPSASYVFDGWALKADADAGDVHYRAGDDVPLLDDTVLYAVWGSIDDGSSVSAAAGDDSLQVTQHLVSGKLNGPVASRGIAYLGSDEAMSASDADLALVQNNMAEAYSEGMEKAYGASRAGGGLSEDLVLAVGDQASGSAPLKAAAAARGYLVYADGNGDEWISYSAPVITGTASGSSASASTFAWHRLYMATFDTSPGNVGAAPSSLASQRIADGYPVYDPGAVTREGADFDTWCSDEGLASAWTVADATAELRSSATKATGDVGLHARWLCTVIYDVDGGSEVADTITVADRIISEPAQPTLSGCTFDGWFTDEEFEKPWDFEEGIVEAGMQLHAKWLCTVQFDALGGNYTPDAQTVTRHAKAAEPARVPTKEGKDFTGWRQSGDGGATLYPTKWDFDSEVLTGMTLYAGWTDKYYNVTFDTAGGSEMATQRVVHGDLATDPGTPVKEGSKFNGWFSDPARKKPFDFANTRITKDTTVYADWLDSLYVSFWSKDTEGADYELYARVPVVQRSKVERPEDPAWGGREGWHVTGWRASSDDGATLDDTWNFDDPVQVSMDLYADWEINHYLVTLDTVGGQPATKTVSYDHGSTVEKPSNPLKVGATFQGWYSDQLYVNEYDFTEPVTGPLHIYAKWQVDTFTVRFESNGGEEIDPQVLTYGERVTKPDAKRTGYRNPVWYADEELTAAYDFEKPVTEDFTLYAGWTPIQYKVSYNRNFPSDTEASSGNKAMSNSTATYDQEHTLSANTYACKGYTFAGWNTEPDGSGEAFENKGSVLNLSATHNATVTLYAQWAEGYADYTVRHWQQDVSGEGYAEVRSDRKSFTAKTHETTAAVANSYEGFTARSFEQKQVGPKGDTVVDIYYDRNTFKVTFDENGHGEAPAAYAGVRYGAKIDAPDEPSADGVEFGGWYRDPGGTSAWNFATDTVTGPVILYAKWTQAPYVVKFEENYPEDSEADWDGRAMADERFVIGRPYRLPFNTLRAKGYVFDSWNTEADGSGTKYEDHDLVNDLTMTPGATVTLYAQWTAGPAAYTVEHYQQDAEGDGYTLVESEQLAGMTHETTEAAAREYEGFTAQAFEQAEVSAKRDTVVKIYYDRLTYDVTFASDAAGSVFRTASGVRHGATVAWPSVNPEADGQAFVGWYTDAACTKAYDFSSPVTSSFTLYAKWTSDYVTVKYAANNDVNTTAAEVRVPKEGSRAARTYTSFHESSATGWARYRPARTVDGTVAYQSVFLGWRGSDGKDYAPGDDIPATDGLVLTARWGELLADSVSADMYASGDAMPDGVSLADGEGAVALFKASLKASPNMDESMVTFKGYSRGYDGAKAAMATSSTSKALGDYRVSGADGEERSYEVEQRLGASSTSEAVSFSPALQVRDADGAEWGLYLRGNSFSYKSLAENAGGAHSWSGAGFVASRDAGGVKDATLKRYETAEWAYQADESYDATADGGPATVAKDASLGTWEWGGDVLSTLSTHSVSASAALPGDGATKLVSDGEGAAADALSTASSDASGGSDGDTSAGSASAGTESPGSGASDSAAPAGDEGDGAASAGAGGDDPASDAARQSAISVTGPLD